MTQTTLADSPTAEATRGIARSAGIIALGNIASRALGLVRDTVKSYYFGATGAVSAYELAVIVPVTVYDLLIGGMVSSALVPVFSEYLAREKRDDLWRLVGTLFALLTVVMGVFVAVIQFSAPAIAAFMAPSYSQDLRDLFVQLLRVLVFGLFFLSLSAVLTGLLYALKRFTLPTFTAAIFNLGIVIGAIILHERLGVVSLAIGLLAGSALQVIVQLPGLRGVGFRVGVDWKHPGLRQIGRLYLPIILGLVISNLAVLISAKLIAATGEQSVAWNDYATSLMQFPLGLVVTAVSVAILPTLSQTAVSSEAEFKATLAQGLKLVIALIVPAVFGMILLARPINALIYEHGTFNALDSEAVSIVLQAQMIGVFFAAIDQPLIIAFYARKDTLTPALVGMAGVGLYLVVAFVISRLRPLVLIDLVVANDAQLAAHALIMLALFRRRSGGLGDTGVWRTLAKAALAASGMAVMAWGTWIAVGWLASLAIGDGLPQRALAVFGPGLVGAGVYFFLANRLNISEVRLAVSIIRQRLGL
ncbi:MAG TPA: murein biosynthesis integral membrane protein MurJ [Anaerolineales bacterium]|nr:murein biosynthesis integral membrane protein MurJ [Anaerolineales bacterium]